jgi:hypothetical protein
MPAKRLETASAPSASLRIPDAKFILVSLVRDTAFASTNSEIAHRVQPEPALVLFIDPLANIECVHSLRIRYIC